MSTSPGGRQERTGLARPLPASAETGLGLGNLGRPAWPGPNGQGAAARARPQDEGRARRRRRCAKAALRESGGVARAPVYWSKIFCSTPPPRRFRRARPSWARWGLRKAMRAAPTLAGRPRARLRDLQLATWAASSVLQDASTIITARSVNTAQGCFLGGLGLIIATFYSASRQTRTLQRQASISCKPWQHG